ncbi:MAG: hypothetical protein AAB370_07815, partial [Verrucomicrobiota bacterium]
LVKKLSLNTVAAGARVKIADRTIMPDKVILRFIIMDGSSYLTSDCWVVRVLQHCLKIMRRSGRGSVIETATLRIKKPRR